MSTVSASTPSAQEKRGHKPASESRVGEIRAKLLEWKQTPQPQRISLRALATEMGASHQLLSFHLRRLDEWQMKEYRKRQQEIRDRVVAEHRSITPEEEAWCAAYGRAALASMIESLVPKMLRKLREQVKRGKLSGKYIRLAKVLASKGYREAQKVLDAHFQRKNNLPVRASGRAKSFGSVTRSVATPLKWSRALSRKKRARPRNRRH